MISRYAILAAMMIAGPAIGQDCSVAEMQDGHASNLHSLLTQAQVAHLTKDEFETTAAYNARAASAASALSSGFTRFSMPGRLAPEYDADSASVSISPYVLPLACGVYEFSLSKEAKAVRFGEAATSPSGVDLGATYCTYSVVSTVAGKPYAASNSYGAKVTVQPQAEQGEGLYFGYGKTGQGMVSGRSAYARGAAFTFKATPDEARSLKANAQLVFWARPVSPYLVESDRHFDAKVTDPVETTLHVAYLVVDARCIGVMDRVSGKVFAVERMPW